MAEAIEWRNIKLRSNLNKTFKVLQIFGYWPPENATVFILNIYKVYAIIMLGFIFIMYVITEIINMMLVLGDLEKVTDSSFLLLTHISQLFKLYYFTKYNRRIKKLAVDLDRATFKPKNYRQFQMIDKTMKGFVKFYYLFLCMSVSTCILWGVVPFFDAGGARIQLPLSAWYPFDTEKYIYFELVFVYQIVGVTINAATNVSMDSTAAGMMSHICAQLDTLNDSLENLGKDFDGDDQEVVQIIQNTKEWEMQMDDALISCVIHHKNIIEMAKEVSSLFSISVLSQFVVSVIIICITMFQLTLVSLKSMKFFSMVLYQGCMLVEIILYCWYGNEIILKSSRLSTSAYNANWISCSTTFKRNLLFVMARTKVPIKIYAGDFFTLSLETFSTILRTSWSYFAVLNRVHSE